MSWIGYFNRHVNLRTALVAVKWKQHDCIAFVIKLSFSRPSMQQVWGTGVDELVEKQQS